MKLFLDKQIRCFCCFLILFLLILSGSGAWLFSLQTDSAKEMLYTRENTMISVLLEQGVSEDVIAAALANTLPEFTGFRKEAGRHIVSAAAWLSVFLMSGVLVFLRKRDRLYQKAEGIVPLRFPLDLCQYFGQKS